MKSPELLRKYVSSSHLENASHASQMSPRSIVHHVDGSMHLRISSKKAAIPNVDFQLQEPSADLEIIFPDIVVDLNEMLYAGLVQASLYFPRITTRGFRPLASKTRWKWAADQLLPGCTARFKHYNRFSLKGLVETRWQRDSYIETLIFPIGFPC